jgi:hypothetical protein
LDTACVVNGLNPNSSFGEVSRVVVGGCVWTNLALGAPPLGVKFNFFFFFLLGFFVVSS